MAHREVIRNDDGEVILATCVDGPLSEEDRNALRSLAEWFHEHADELVTTEMAERQARSLERIRERSKRLRGGA